VVVRDYRVDDDTLYPLDPALWAQRHFGAASLGDVRRVQRAVTLAAAMARQPGGSIPQLFLHRYDVKAAYTLLDRPRSRRSICKPGTSR
jgi:hypothetical protein